MDQPLHGVSFPKVSRAELEVGPFPWKSKGIALPWLGFGVGAGKDAFELQELLMKRKRGEAAGVGSSSITGSDKVELNYLRHDGHFHGVLQQKKDPPCTFEKQYQLVNWRNVKPLTEEDLPDMLEDEPATKISKPLTCGVDCYKVRAEIFQKAEVLMAQKPEKLHMKVRLKLNNSEAVGSIQPDAPTYRVDAVCTDQSASPNDELDRKASPVARHPGVAKGHQGVQTVFTQNKKIQTVSTDHKQVQWAIFPTDALSPKLTKTSDEIQIYAKEMHREDSSLANAPLQTDIEPALRCPDVDPPLVTSKELSDRSGAKKSSSKHHLLLYKEAVEIANEQRDLERAREQRQDFWLVYERELKRGKGLKVKELEAEKKGKKIAEQDDEEEREARGEDLSGQGKIQLDNFLDEAPTLKNTSRGSSSPGEMSGPSEGDLSRDVVLGLRGLIKGQTEDSLQSLETMEQQLNPETTQPAARLSPTELDCMKAAILSHNFYPRLVSSFIDQHKAGAAPDQVDRLEKIRNQVLESWRPGSPVGKPAHEEKIRKYKDILTKFERELEKPFQDAMDFSWQMEHYLDRIPSKGRSEGGASSGPNNLKDFEDERA